MHDYIAREDSNAALDFTRNLIDKLFEIAENRIEGVSRDWVSKGLTMIPYKKRCIYLRVIKDDLFVVRVLHEKQDVSSQNFQG